MNVCSGRAWQAGKKESSLGLSGGIEVCRVVVGSGEESGYRVLGMRGKSRRAIGVNREAEDCRVKWALAWIPGLLVASPLAQTCLDLPSSAANSLDSRIAGCQPTCLDLPSPATTSLKSPSSSANRLDSRIVGCQLTCLYFPSSAANSLHSQISFFHLSLLHI